MTLNEEYLAVLDRLDGDAEGRKKAWAYLETSTDIYQGHVVATDYFPKMYDRRLRDRLMEVAGMTYGIIEKIMDRYLADPEYRSVYEFDPRLVELILADRGYASHLPFARIDLFLNEDDLSVRYCEFNADGSSGMNENREAENAIVLGDAFQLFSAEHRMESMNPVMWQGWVDEFMRIYNSWTKPVDVPHVAIVDYLDHSVIEEFKLYRALFEENGINCSIYDVRDLTYEEGRLIGHKPYEGLGLEDVPIDAIWRRAVTNDVLDNYEASLPFINAYLDGNVCLIGSFLGQLIHDKQIFKVMQDDRTKAFLTPEECDFIDAAFPKTMYLGKDTVDLEAIKAEPAKWIIKPTDGYACRDVFPGPSYDVPQWSEIIDKYADTATGVPFLLQEFCTPYKTPALPMHGLGEEWTAGPVPYNNLNGLYMIDGKLAGIFTRLGPAPLILGRCGGLTAASFWVDCDSPFYAYESEE